MSPTQLHTLLGPNNEPFEALYTDPRFVGLRMFLQANRPRAKSQEAHGMIQDSGRLEQFMEVLDLIDKVQRPPVVLPESSRPIAYSSSRHPENNQP